MLNALRLPTSDKKKWNFPHFVANIFFIRCIFYSWCCVEKCWFIQHLARLDAKLHCKIIRSRETQNKVSQFIRHLNMIKTKVFWFSLIFLASCGVGRSFVRKDFMELCPHVRTQLIWRRRLISNFCSFETSTFHNYVWLLSKVSNSFDIFYEGKIHEESPVRENDGIMECHSILLKHRRDGRVQMHARWTGNNRLDGSKYQIFLFRRPYDTSCSLNSFDSYKRIWSIG